MSFVIPNGIWPSLITPFLDSKELDLSSFELHVARLDLENISGFLVAGSVGEGSLLSCDECAQLIKIVRKISKKPILLGIVGFNFDHISSKLDLDCDAFLAVPPIYFKPPQQDIVKYFNMIAKYNNLLVYNNPSRVGVRIADQTYEQLYDSPNIIGVKECDDDRFIDLAKRFPKWSWFSGNDDAFPLLHQEYKSSGLISTMANLFPNMAHQIFQYDNSCCAEWLENCKVFFSKPNPIVFKERMFELGLIKSPVFRAPFNL
jgi:4-hydroxy-tetrahydrodipicolinate synthase